MRERLANSLALIGGCLLFVSVVGNFSIKTRVISGGTGAVSFLAALFLSGRVGRKNGNANK